MIQYSSMYERQCTAGRDNRYGTSRTTVKRGPIAFRYEARISPFSVRRLKTRSLLLKKYVRACFNTVGGTLVSQ